MGIPDEVDGPVRKRSRLSLRTSHRPDQIKSSSGTSCNEMTTEMTTAVNHSSHAVLKTLRDQPSECIDLTADLPSSPDPSVAPVASLHNLGNTCFLNSMLEVLRYTPGFLDGLNRLQVEILEEENKRETKGTNSSSVRSAWQIVKNACAMYAEMDKKEEQYTEIATADASSMAVRPSLLLDNIRELNPMFEGHFQHDAQELLRCLLCYIEDAEKELIQLKDRESKTVKDVDGCGDGDTPGLLATEHSEQTMVRVTGKHARANKHCSSLKGGEGHDRSNNPERQHDLASHVHVENILKCEKNMKESVMTLCSKNDSASRNSTADKICSHVRSISLEGEGVESNVSGLSSFLVAKGRKRKRSKVSCASHDMDTSDIAKTSNIRTRGFNGKMACSNAHSSSKSVVGACEETDSAVSGFVGGTHSEKVQTDVDLHQSLQKSAAVPLNCTASPNSSDESLAAVTSEIKSSKTNLLSPQPNHIKRLGMRGCAVVSSHCQTSEKLVQDINNRNNSGDVNNNSDIFINSNSNNRSSRSASLAVDNVVNVDVLDIVASSQPAVSPLSPEKLSQCPAMSESPVRSPVRVEHTDEILVLPESDTSPVDSAINTVTRKYISSVSQSTAAASSSLTSQSVESGFVSEVPSAVSSLHVFEPNKEINVKVQISPKKKSTVFELNVKQEAHMSACSLDDTSGSPVSVSDASSNGVHTRQKRDSGLWTWLNDASVHEGPSQFPDIIQSSNVTVESMKVASSGDTLPRQTACTQIYPSCNPQTKEDLPRQVNISPRKSSPRKQVLSTRRSPGTNVAHDIDILQPKLELRKCDWLGVSPVKSVSASEAIFQSQKRMSMGSMFRARRKLMCDGDPENSPQSLGHFSIARNLIQTQQSLSCLSDCTDSVSSNETPVAVENDSRMRCFKTRSLRPTRKSVRTPHQTTKLRKPVSCTSNEKLIKPQSLLLGQNMSLKTLSVALDRCDWLLKAQPRLPVSVQQAMIDIQIGKRITSQHQEHKTEKGDVAEPSQVKTSSMIGSEIRLQSSHTTLVERLFGGAMMHQTKCLECEVARHRQEVFMDISVPVRSLPSEQLSSDDDSDDESPSNRNKSGDSSLSKLIQAFSSIERLKDANKYFCEECMRHVEAERSSHYLTLPTVLTLHLKRFSANSRLFGHLSKLTDKVAIPQTLPCLQYQCKSECSNPSHTFSLFAIVTHSGSSILHGHYRAYVKVQSLVNPSVFRNLVKSKVKTEEEQLVETKIDTYSDLDSFLGKWTVENSDITSESAGLCNGTKHGNNDADDIYFHDQTLIKATTSSRSFVSNNKLLGDERMKWKAYADTKSHLCGAGHVKAESKSTNDEHGSIWLECDDECIRVMEEHEFIEKLEERDGCLIGTPYVLFYHKQLV